MTIALSAHRDDRVGRHRAGEHAVLPAEALQALAEHLEEARVGVEHGNAHVRAAESGGRALELPAGGGRFRHRGPSLVIAPGRCSCRKRPVHRIFTRCQRRIPRPATNAQASRASRMKPPASSHQSADPATALRIAGDADGDRDPDRQGPRLAQDELAHRAHQAAATSTRDGRPPRAPASTRTAACETRARSPARSAARRRRAASRRPGPRRRRTSRTSSARARRRT